MTYTEQTTLHDGEFITASAYNAFCTNITDHNDRLNQVLFGGGTVASVAIGCIIMWYGTPAELEEGWAICDGENGTPDLRDMFIIGAGGTYSVGATGGLESHNHAGASVNSASGHVHSIGFSTSQSLSNVLTNITSVDLSGSNSIHYHSSYGLNTASSSSHSHSATSTGVSSGLPPYKAIYLIMRIS